MKNPLIQSSITLERAKLRNWQLRKDLVPIEELQIQGTILTPDMGTISIEKFHFIDRFKTKVIVPESKISFLSWDKEDTKIDSGAIVSALILALPSSRGTNRTISESEQIASWFSNLYFEQPKLENNTEVSGVYIFPLLYPVPIEWVRIHSGILKDFFALECPNAKIIDPSEWIQTPPCFHDQSALFISNTGIGLDLEKILTSIEEFGIDTIRSKFLDFDPRWRPPEEAGLPAGGEFIALGGDEARRDVLNSALDVLLRRKYLYNHNNTLVRIIDEKIEPIDSVSQLQGIIASHAECYFERKSGRNFVLFPQDHASTLLSSGIQQEFRKIEIFTDIPILGNDFQPVELGYSSKFFTYRSGAEVLPSHKQKVISKILSEFNFRDPTTDRTNLLAVLLTLLVHHHFPGSVPFLLLMANQRGVGKTLLAMIIGILRDGKDPVTITFNSSDEELEKRLCSLFLSGARTCILDNVKITAKDEFVSSSVLERSLTDRVLSFRILGRSQNYEAINNAQFILTANSAALSPDLVSRSLLCNLHFEGDPSKRKFQNKGLLDFVKEKRMEVISELLGMFQNWQKAGSPRADVSHRFLAWAELIGGVLEVNGYEGFLRHSESSASEIDPDLQDFLVLSEGMILGSQYSSQELLRLAAARGGIFQKIIRMQNDRGRASEFGKLLSRFLDREVSVNGGGRAIFQRCGRGPDNSSLYEFRAIHPEAPEASTNASVLDLRRMKRP